MTSFKTKYPVNIRFRDFDSLGHVNNAVYFTYLEEARIRYFEEIIAGKRVEWRDEGIILARMEIDFRKPITGYNNYIIYVGCSRIGNKSFDIEYRITYEEGSEVNLVVAEAKSVMVCYDYKKNQSIPIKDEWRSTLREFEGIDS